jgi:hypothetical protein
MAHRKLMKFELRQRMTYLANGANLRRVRASHLPEGVIIERQMPTGKTRPGDVVVD